MYDGNPGEIDFGQVSVRFELARVQVIGSRLYYEIVHTWGCVEIVSNHNFSFYLVFYSSPPCTGHAERVIPYFYPDPSPLRMVGFAPEGEGALPIVDYTGTGAHHRAPDGEALPEMGTFFQAGGI